jgi:glutamine synthetase type III
MFKRRIKNIQKFLSENHAVLITSNPNRLYFTGFSSSAGDLVITKEKAFFFKNEVLECMANLRLYVDDAEKITDEKYWPFPSYTKLLFGVN